MKTYSEYIKAFPPAEPTPEWSKVEIACDKCGAQLEKNNHIVLCSHPPKSLLRCTVCKCPYYL